MNSQLSIVGKSNFGCNRGNYGLLFVAAISFLGFGGYGAFLASKQAAMAAWPETDASIKDFHPGFDAENGCWGPRVRFEYSVDGMNYVGSRLNPSPFNYQSEQQFGNETGKLQPGAKIIKCWYNPKAPREAYVVNSGVSIAPLVLVLAGFLNLCMLCKALCTPGVQRSPR